MTVFPGLLCIGCRNRIVGRYRRHIADHKFHGPGQARVFSGRNSGEYGSAETHCLRTLHYMQLPVRQSSAQLKAESRPRTPACDIDVPKLSHGVFQNVGHLRHFARNPLENAFVNLAPRRVRAQAGDDSTRVGVEVRIASTYQIRSKAKAGWTGCRFSFQSRVVGRLRGGWIPASSDDVVTVRLSAGFSVRLSVRFSVQQIVEPLDHDSRREIRERDELVWNHVTIGVERRRKCRRAQAGLVGSSQQTFVSAHRVRDAARTDRTNSQCAAGLIVPSHHYNRSWQQTELAGGGCIQFSCNRSCRYGNGQARGLYFCGSENFFGPTPLSYVKRQIAGGQRIVDVWRKSQPREDITNHSEETNRGSKNIWPVFAEPKNLWDRIHGMSDQAGDFEKMFPSEYSFEPHRFFRGSIVLVENGRSDCFVAGIDRHEGFAVRTQA